MITDDLRAAGFSESEVTKWAAQKREQLLGAGFSVREADDYLGNPAPSNTVGGQTLARKVAPPTPGYAPGTVAQTNPGGPKSDMWPQEMWAVVQAGANTAASMTGGFAGMLYGALEAGGANVTRAMAGESPVDVEQNAMRRAQQWTPELPSAWQTDLGKQYTEHVGQWLSQHGPSVIGIGPELAMLGNVMKTDHVVAAVSSLAEPVRAELMRRVGGQILNGDDFRNVATNLADKPEEVRPIEKSLRDAYDKTGIGPFTLGDLADKDAKFKNELAKGIPQSLERFIEKPAEEVQRTGVGGVPPAETIEATKQLPAVPDEGRTMVLSDPLSEQPEAVRNALSGLDEVQDLAKGETVDIRKRQSVLNSLLECLS